MATIRVSNNQNTYDVEETDLPKAMKDGYQPLISVAKGDSKFDVHPQDLSKALADGYRPIQHAPEVSMLESGARGLAQGATFGFADEITGALESAITDKTYEQARNESRQAYQDAQKANPWTYGAGELGGAVGTAFIPGLGVLNAAKEATLATKIGLGAAQGGLSGLGMSDSHTVGGMAKDAVVGGALGAAAPVALAGLGKAAGYVGENFNSGISKVGSIASGADQDALLRNIQRPTQMAAAEADGFANKLSQQAMDQIQAKGKQVGADVGSAKLNFLKKSGDDEFSTIGNSVAQKIDDFTAMNAPSQKGFSALTNDQQAELENLSKVFKGGDLTGEDLVKSREYLDNIEKLAGKYDKNGTGPYVNFLKSIRGELDAHLDKVSPEIDKANTAFSDFLGNKKTLGLNNESTAESIVSNLYGANKTAKQNAAQALLDPATMESVQDIAANKAVSGATGPSGSDFGRRTMLGHVAAIPTFGLSEVAVSPTAWKVGLRALGRVEDRISYTLDKSPEFFGEFAKPLQEAAARGPYAVASTNFLLSQRDPNYRAKIKQLNDEGQ